MERHQANALAVARWLESRPEVARVIYPGLRSHPQHALARRQMSGFGGMVSFVLRARGRGRSAGPGRFLGALRVFTCAESLGGVESLAEHPAIMTHASIPPDRRRALGISDGLIRLSVGIEHVDDLRRRSRAGVRARRADRVSAAGAPPQSSQRGGRRSLLEEGVAGLPVQRDPIGAVHVEAATRRTLLRGNRHPVLQHDSR